MRHLEVGGAVRPLYGSLGVKGLKKNEFHSFSSFVGCLVVKVFSTRLQHGCTAPASRALSPLQWLVTRVWV